MALINCPECGKEISDKAKICPNCGTAISNIFCRFCGEKIEEDTVICPHCGKQVKELNNGTNGNIVINNNNSASSSSSASSSAAATAANTVVPGHKLCNKWVSLILCIFLGFIGAHKFYEGKVGMGILYLFTGGLFGIGWIIDIIAILAKPNPYYA